MWLSSCEQQPIEQLESKPDSGWDVPAEINLKQQINLVSWKFNSLDLGGGLDEENKKQNTDRSQIHTCTNLKPPLKALELL